MVAPGGGIIPQTMLEAFENASAFIAVLRGPDHVYELANAQYRRLMGDRVYVGRPVREVAPDVADQAFTLPWLPLGAIVATCAGLTLVAALAGSRRAVR